MSAAIEILGGALLIIGAFFVLIGATGLLRLPDILTRIHGASITDTLGAGAILLGLAFTDRKTARVAHLDGAFKSLGLSRTGQSCCARYPETVA